MENTAHWNTHVAHLPWNNTAQPPASHPLPLLGQARDLGISEVTEGSLQSLNCPTVELPFLCVRSVRNAQSSPLQRDYQETQQSPSSPHPAETFIVPLALCPPCFPEVHASKQLCFLDGHSPFVFLSAATGFLVSAVSNSS